MAEFNRFYWITINLRLIPGKAAAVMAQAHLSAHGHGGHVGGGGAQRADLLPHEALQLLPGGLPPSASARLPPDGAIMHNIGESDAFEKR